MTRRGMYGSALAFRRRWLAGIAVVALASCGTRALPSNPRPAQPATRDLGEIRGESVPTAWTCAGGTCPWGASSTGHALAWPVEARPVATRLGYSVAPAIYLPAATANGAAITIESGTARAHAGPPGEADHRVLATLGAGQTLRVAGLTTPDVLSVQGDAPFRYRITLPPVTVPEPAEARAARRVIASTQALWCCNVEGCRAGAWTGAVIAWPAGSAYQSNARRVSEGSRSVFSTDGTPLYPYMGAWAQGCEVTAEAGVVQIIEWRRGSETWRSTWLFPGQSHLIDLVPPENGAMIETYDGSPGFSVSLRNCTPQKVE